MAIGAFAGYLAYELRAFEDNPEFGDSTIIEKSGDTTLIYRNGSPVYYRIKDSVMYDFIDSTLIDWDNVEHIQR